MKPAGDGPLSEGVCKGKWLSQVGFDLLVNGRDHLPKFPSPFYCPRCFTQIRGPVSFLPHSLFPLFQFCFFSHFSNFVSLCTNFDIPVAQCQPGQIGEKGGINTQGGTNGVAVFRPMRQGWA